MQRICIWKVPFFGTASRERLSGDIFCFARRLQYILAYYSRRFVNRFTRAIRIVTSSELLTKQAMRKRIYYMQKKLYVLQLLLNVVTAGIEALVFGNKSLYACVKKYAACGLSQVLYCETLKSCAGTFRRKAVESWHPWNCASAYSFSHSSISGEFNWELFDHPPYRPDLARSHYHQFT
jgi:hypothetical protein